MFKWLKSLFGESAPTEPLPTKVEEPKLPEPSLNDWIIQMQGDGDAPTKELIDGIASLPEGARAQAVLKAYKKGNLRVAPYAMVDAIKQIASAEADGKYDQNAWQRRSIITHSDNVIREAINSGDLETATAVMLLLESALAPISATSFWGYDHYDLYFHMMGPIDLLREHRDQNIRIIWGRLVQYLKSKVDCISAETCCCWEHDTPKLSSALHVLKRAGEERFVSQIAERFLVDQVARSNYFDNAFKTMESFLEQKEEVFQRIFSAHIQPDASYADWEQEWAGRVFLRLGYTEGGVRFLLQAAKSNRERSAKKVANFLLESKLPEAAKLAYGEYLDHRRSEIKQAMSYSDRPEFPSCSREYKEAKGTLFEPQTLELARYEMAELEKLGNFWKARTLASLVGDTEKVNLYSKLGA